MVDLLNIEISALGLVFKKYKQWDRAAVARWAHNPKVIGSIPIPATMCHQSLVQIGGLGERY